MDEEDRSEFGIAPKLIQTHNEFSGQKRSHPTRRFHDGPIPGIKLNSYVYTYLYSFVLSNS